MKRVSVVILNWNGVDMLRKFIPSVMDNSVGEGIEICVADNTSSAKRISIPVDKSPRRSGIFKIFLIMPT